MTDPSAPPRRNPIVAAVLEHLGAPAVVLGNAYGNRIARKLATLRQDLVSAVVLVCAGGEIRPEPEISAALGRFFDESLPEAERLDGARIALFAPGHEVDPSFLDTGRSTEAARAQMAATRAEPDRTWLAGGDVPMLIIQGAEDRIAPPENGHRLRDRWPDRTELVDIPDAGHAVQIEQPDATAAAIIDFVRRQLSGS